MQILFWNVILNVYIYTMKKKVIIKDTTVNKDCRLTLRLTPRQYFELNNISEVEGLSKANLMRCVLQDFIDRYYDYKEEQNEKQQ